jgi:hypothetical protein
MLIYNPVALAAVYGEQARSGSSGRPSDGAASDTGAQHRR